MARFSAEVENDISKRSKVFGVVLGLVCIPTAFMGGVIGTCCPLGAFVSVIPVVFFALTAGFLAAMFLNWSRVTHEESLGVGVKVGMRTGLIASSIGAVSSVIISIVFAGLLFGSLAANDPSFGAAESAGAAELQVMNIVAGLIGIGIGTVLGILGGVIGAAWKRPSGG